MLNHPKKKYLDSCGWVQVFKVSQQQEELTMGLPTDGSYKQVCVRNGEVVGYIHGSGATMSSLECKLVHGSKIVNSSKTGTDSSYLIGDKYYEDAFEALIREFCFVRDILTIPFAQAIFDLGNTYSLAGEFRNRVLAKSQKGKEYLKQYTQHIGTVADAMKYDPEAAVNALHAWWQTAPLFEEVMRLLEDPTLSSKKTFFTEKQYEAITKLTQWLIIVADDDALTRDLGIFEKDLGELVGFTPAQLLNSLRPEGWNNR